MRVEIVDSIRRVPAVEWNSVAEQAGLYSSHEWLGIMEAVTLGRCLYLLVRDGARMVAGLPLYFVDQELNDYYLPEGHFRLRNSTGDEVRACVLGTKEGYHNGPLLTAGLSPEQHRQAVGTLLDAVQECAAAEGVELAVGLFLTWQGFHDLAADSRVGTPVVSYAGETRLEVVGERLEDFVTTLPRKPRQQFWSEMERFRAAGLEIVEYDPVVHLGLLAKLVDQNLQKYGRSSSPDEHESTLRRQFAVMGEHTRLFVCRSGDVVLGALLAYVWNGWLYARMGGFDYDRLPGAFEYFNLSIYHPLRYCYDNGLRGIYVGSGSQLAKGRRGARIEPLLSVALPLNGDDAETYVPQGGRSLVREYWESEMARQPSAFDSGLWREALDLCSPATELEATR